MNNEDMNIDPNPGPIKDSASVLPDDEDISADSDGERPQKRLKMAEKDFAEADPAEFLLSNSKYHDCHLTVGNPETDDVEKIGVSSIHLIAHSSVFRDMLADSALADPSGSNTHISDISPATFKLMLRHVYGGKLPKMTPEEAAELALCADKYNIQHLVEKAAKSLKPMRAEDVFPAFMCAVYINCPDLELQVSKIIQQETDKIIKSKNFSTLDENCILLIVKQGTLNISELELWNSLVRWAESQVQKHPEKTLRGCLSKVLPYVRLLVLTVEEIAKHVLPTKVLTPEEYFDLTLAVTNKQAVQMPGLCNLQENRVIYKEKREYIFKSQYDFISRLEKLENEEFSTLTIKTTKTIEIATFTFQSFNVLNHDYSLTSNNLTCKIEICTSSKGLVTTHETITVRGTAIPNQLVSLPVKRNNGQSLVLKANELYTLKIQTSPLLPVHKLVLRKNDYTYYKHVKTGMIVKFEDPFHVREIAYKVLE